MGMSEMWLSTGDDDPNERTTSVFPTHWWRRPVRNDNQETCEGDSEFILTMDAIVSLLRVISVCPTEDLAIALCDPDTGVSLDEQERLVKWCDNLADDISNYED
jgi:hypothetical protein